MSSSEQLPSHATRIIFLQALAPQAAQTSSPRLAGRQLRITPLEPPQQLLLCLGRAELRVCGSAAFLRRQELLGEGPGPWKGGVGCKELTLREPPEAQSMGAGQGPLLSCPPGAYQVTWGGGEAWTVQVSRTVVCSQTAWERSGIQNQGPRPEHRSLSSLASRTFFSVWRWEGACDFYEPGHHLSPVFAVTFPPTPRLWSRAHVGWSRAPPQPAAERQRATEGRAWGQGQTLLLTSCETIGQSSISLSVKWG